MKKIFILGLIVFFIFACVKKEKPATTPPLPIDPASPIPATPDKAPKKIKPGTPDSMRHEGLFFLNAGKLDQAEPRLLEALKSMPEDTSILHGLGILKLNQLKFNEAITYFNKVIEINPNYFDAYNAMGIAYIEKGQFEDARKNLLNAANAEKNKTPENAFLNLANLEIRQKNFEAAMRYVEKGIEKNNRFAPLFNLKGYILESCQQYPQAIENYEKALSLLTIADITYLINLGRAYLKDGQKGKAMDNFEKALASAPTPELKTQINDFITGLNKK